MHIIIACHEIPLTAYACHDYIAYIISRSILSFFNVVEGLEHGYAHIVMHMTVLDNCIITCYRS